MTEKKMTKRESFNALLSIPAVAENADLVAFIEHEIVLLDKKNSAERKPTPKQIAAAEYDAKLMEAIGDVLTDEFQGRAVFAEALDVSPSKASVLLNKMVAAGTVVKGEYKGEKGKLVGYKRA